MELLKRGSRGDAVKKLQEALLKKGYQIAVDGIFGKGTTEAVRDLQSKNKLTVDGIAGKDTWKALESKKAEDSPKPSKPEKLSPLPKGQAKALTEEDIIEVAQHLGVEIAAIKAVYEVESSGKGFLKDKRPKILFEGHVFWRELKKLKLDPQNYVKGNENILYAKWTREHYKGGADEYPRLEQARQINDEAALKSASWGTFQIMGFNYKACGFKNVRTYVDAQHLNEGEHLKAFGNFIKSANLVRHLKSKDWAAFAKGYNGPAYKTNKYDEKMAVAYAKHKA